jgi:CheY-like chemotaxis protein
MDTRCLQCGGPADPAGHEDGHAFFQCPTCGRVWATDLIATASRSGPRERLPRVLVADDAPEMLRLMTAWIEDEACDVITALSGRAALDAAGLFDPDVVFLDVIMPPPGGFEVCEALNQRRAPAVVLMTGVPGPETARRAADLGVVALLIKPFDREAVIGALATALTRCRLDPLSGLRLHAGAHPRLP